MIFDEIRDLLAAAGFGLHRQTQVGPIEPVDEHRRRAAEQPCHNIRARSGIGRRGEGDGLHAAEVGLHLAERRIFGAKIVAPLRNAMRLVDRQKRNLGALEELDRLGSHQPFGRNIDETQFTARNSLEHRPVLGGVVRGIEGRRGDAIAAQLRDLIAHQRNQRRHHDGQAVAEQRRKLVAQRLAAAGRHDRQHVAAVEGSRRRSRPGRAGMPRSRRFCEVRTLRRQGPAYRSLWLCSTFVLNLAQEPLGAVVPS